MYVETIAWPACAKFTTLVDLKTRTNAKAMSAYMEPWLKPIRIDEIN
jgi:hypothetical protein